MFDFFKKSDNNSKGNLNLKTAGIAIGILIHSSNLTDVFTKTDLKSSFPELQEFDKKQLIELDLIFAISLLMFTQRFFYENIIKDNREANVFEKQLYLYFSLLHKTDPTSYAKDFIDYVNRVGDKGQFKYVGSKICKLLNKESGILFESINLAYGKYISTIFIPSIIKTWKSKDGELHELISKIKVKLPI